VSFGVGDLVVCIRAFRKTKNLREKYPVVGQVYTIRDIELPDDAECGLRLEEIINPPYDYRQGLVECWFDSQNFRPVRKTDISIFDVVLVSVPKEKVKETQP
jgi:hypothetical protein